VYKLKQVTEGAPRQTIVQLYHTHPNPLNFHPKNRNFTYLLYLAVLTTWPFCFCCSVTRLAIGEFCYRDDDDYYASYAVWSAISSTTIQQPPYRYATRCCWDSRPYCVRRILLCVVGGRGTL